MFLRLTMGQTQFHNVPGQVAMLTDRLRLHAVGVKQLTALSYEQFLESVSLLNGLWVILSVNWRHIYNPVSAKGKTKEVYCCNIVVLIVLFWCFWCVNDYNGSLYLSYQYIGVVLRIYISIFFCNFNFVFSVLICRSSVFCILALGSGQRLLYRLGSGLVLVLVLVTV